MLRLRLWEGLIWKAVDQRSNGNASAYSASGFSDLETNMETGRRRLYQHVEVNR